VKLPPFVYRTLNVVARLPGRSSEAILLDAHFDTLVDSVGAADDAAGTAALVETARALAREGPLARTVIINLNGGEEAGLFGAAGFLQHRWAKDVSAYLYLEALPAGKAGLFGAGPGNSRLARIYARVAPSPLGNVVGQDLAQSGLLPHNGDFTPFHEAGLRGLDVTTTGDGWAYHTRLDRAGRLQAGSLQHMGDTALAVTRALANAPAAPKADRTGVIYYDFLGLGMAAYGAATSRLLSVAALLLAGLALVVMRRRRLISLRGAAVALGWIAAAVIAGVLAAVAAGVLLGMARPHGWFSAPVLVLPAFGAPALAAMLGIHALWRARSLRRAPDLDRHASHAWAGGLLFWSLWLALATVGQIGAGYLALWWVAGGSLGLVAPLIFPDSAHVPATAEAPPPARAVSRARAALAILGLAPGAVVTIELVVLFLKYFVPITGLLPSPVPLDFLIAALVGGGVAAVGALALAVPHRVGGFGRGALGAAAVAIVGLAITALHFPYEASRPKRLLLAHVADDQTSALLLGSVDALPLGPALTSIPGLVAARPGWPRYESWSPPFTHERAAPPPALPPPRAEITSDQYDAGTDRRRLGVRVFSPGAQLRLAVPADRLVAWSLAPSLDSTLTFFGQQVIHFEGLGPEGHEISLTVKGHAPLPVELRAIDRAPANEPAVQALLRELPAWTTTTSVTMRAVRLAL